MLFEPDVLVPSQFLPPDTLATKSREARLVLAILEESIAHYLSQVKRRTQDHVQTRDWIMSNDRHFLSYLWICDLFRLDPYALRRELIRRRARGERSGLKPRLIEKKRGKVGGRK